MRVSEILSDPGYAELKRYILAHTGLAYYADKDEDLASRLSRRITVESVGDCSSYLSRLLDPNAGPREMEGLVGELTIGETYFFRQRAQFDVLRDTILPDLFERNQSSRRLSIWSAGCATGAEPYSISMLLRLEMADKIAGWDISILGTDINVDFLARARQAKYDAWAFRETPETLKATCFERQGSHWALRREYKAPVSFLHHNLVHGPGGGAGVAPPAGAPFDLIFCRNVMIYFDLERVRRTVAGFYDALVEGGWLLVGHAEPNPDVFRRFQTVSFAHVTAYRKGAAGVRHEGSEAPVRRAALGEPGPQVTSEPSWKTAAGAARLPAESASGAQGDYGSVEDARVLADRGQWSEAEALCRKLIHADTLNAAAHFTLGLVLEHIGRRDEAARELRRAVYLDRGFAMAHYHLGTCLQGGKQPEQARKAFLNAIDLLAGKSDDEILAHGDGITVMELRDLSKMHLETLNRV